ncbi:DNA repair exonuclease [Cohnella fermenti]|uniref:DNA repair exonuclease n=1 Tax=Cohnella fermenti TaxID=2565925 RepID=A0A4S4C662_9BACL|nr:DNA repair exonuclease [Cohnella fermenti]
MPFTFLHAADLHLDSPFRGLARAPKAVRERLKESTFASFEKLVSLSRLEKVDFVVLAGDLYDAADRSLRAQLRMQKQLTLLAEDGIPVFIVHGNHDPENGWQARLDYPEQVTVFGSRRVEFRAVDNRRGERIAHVYGISYREAAVRENLAAGFEKKEGAPFHLALLHANVDGDAAHDNYAPCRLSELAGKGFDYWALGHVHGRRVLGESPHVVYPGNSQGRSIREIGPKGGYVVSVSETGDVSLSFRDTADVLWTELAVSIEGIRTEQELKGRLEAAMTAAAAEAGGRPVVLRLRLEGAGVQHDSLQSPQVVAEWLESLREWYGSPDESDAWVWLDSLDVRTRPELGGTDPAEGDGFLAELLRQARSAEADGSEGRRLLEEALEPALRQPKLREWTLSLGDERRSELIGQAARLAAALLREKE